ncbi:MAG: class I SAM-dependent methyltransferase [Candidatus Aenigmatarchaeota archaeon]
MQTNKRTLLPVLWKRVIWTLKEVKNEKIKTKKDVLKILDIGCGSGDLAFLLSKLGNEVYGIEKNVSLAKKARKRGVKTKIGDIEKGISLYNKKFDVVCLFQVLEHILDTEKILTECYKLLSRGGIILISIPNIACLSNRIRLFFGLYPRWVAPSLEHWHPGTHIRAFTKSTIFQLLNSAGFKIEDVKGDCISFCPSRHLLIYSTRLGDFFPSLSEILLIKGRKI